MKIAFLGLGKMGAGMAGCLLRGGQQLNVWNRTASKASVLAEAGATICSSIAEAVGQADIVISSLMDDHSVQAVFGDEGGAAQSMKQGAVHVCVTTISPECADWLAMTHAEAGNLYVSGPVLGRPDAAAAGQLVQFLAGSQQGIEAVQTVCSIFAPTSIPIDGPARLANLQKLCANFFVIGVVELMAECLTFAEKSGASRDIMAHLMGRSFANPGLQGYAQRMAVRDTDGTDGFSLSGGFKDVGLMLKAAADAQCPIDLATLIADKMQRSLELGSGDDDWSVIQEMTRLRAGLK